MKALLLLALMAGAEVEGVLDGWVWPVPIHVDGRKSKISSGVKMRAGKDGKMGTDDDYMHRGVDIMFRRAKCGKQKLPLQSECYEIDADWPALAASAGKVTFARKTSTGVSVVIKHDKNLSTAYHHLLNSFVAEGDQVTAGQPVGLISFNPEGYKLSHLHFDYILKGKYEDPAPHMKSWKHIDRPPVPGVSVGSLPWSDVVISHETAQLAE